MAMATQNNLDPSRLERQLAEAQKKAENGNYEAAVRAVREAKFLAPKNVYVLAFEKQAEQLSELASAKTLTDEQRTDILESIPSIIERALESSRSPGIPADTSALRTATDALQEKKEKAAALEWLKNQYFQHAHEYIRKGEYQHALAEIRRVYIIDPSNAIARDFEKEFEALAQMKRSESIRVYPSATVDGGAYQSSAAPSNPAPRAQGDYADATPTMTEEWSSPSRPKRDVPHAPRVPEKRAVKKKGSTLLLVLIFLALAVLGAVVYLYYQRKFYKPPPVTSLAPSSSEHFIGAPGEAAEQNFLVSSDESSGDTPQVTELAAREPAPETVAQAECGTSGDVFRVPAADH
jgi:tetratricopeptide (TPR) repeat protein